MPGQAELLTHGITLYTVSMDEIAIRTLTTQDVPSLRTMHAKSWRDSYANESEGVSQEWLSQETATWLTPEALARSKEHFNKALSDEDQFIRIAVADNEVVGFIHASKHETHNELDALYVDSSHHGSGLAQQLVGEALLWFDANKPIKLDVVVYNARAIRFYEKLGFHVVEGSNRLFKDIIPIVGMVKNPT